MHAFRMNPRNTLVASLGSLLFSANLLHAQANSTTENGNGGAYEPPAASLHHLGTLAEILRHSPPIESGSFPDHPAKFISRLPGGQTYFEVQTMDVDDDGSSDGSPRGWTPSPVRKHKNGKMYIEHVHQDNTSYGGILPRRADKTDFISAFETAYIVLPLAWSTGHGFHVGDGAVVLRGDRLIYAVVADFGPSTKIGEMSIKGHELFGEQVVVEGHSARLDSNGKSVPGSTPGTFLLDPALVTRNSSSTGPFLVVVFPNTSVMKRFKTVEDSIQPTLEPMWSHLT